MITRKGVVAGAVFTLFILGVTSSAGASSAPAVSIASDRLTAQSINLTGADLPGWQESPNPPDASDQSLNAKLSACAGGPPPSIDVVDVTSANFTKGHTEVSSDVTMVRTHADGVADLKSGRGPRAVSCLRRILVPALTKAINGAKVSNLKVSDSRPRESLPDSFGFQLSMTVSVTGQSGVKVSLPISVRLIGFLVGRAEVSLNETQQGRGKPVSVEASLLRVLLSRALSHAN